MKWAPGLLGAVLICALVAPAPAGARDAVVTSFDGTPIVTHFFPGDGASKAKPAPTIMVGPGWSIPGETDPEGGSIAGFIDAGYNVLTWDPRGFGGSGGTVMIDHPEFEGRDAQALIDFIAEQPEAELDGPGDPRLGMSGSSYGGGIQLVTAAIDRRVDAIAPTIAWNSLVSSLFRAGKIKLGWGLVLVGAGLPQSIAGGVISPAGVQTGNQSPQFYSTVADGVATGGVSEENRRWFAEHGPDFLLKRIRVPTLIVQGTVDTLFTLDEADANYRSLERRGIPLKMVFFCGGHGVCLTGSDGESSALGDSARAQERRLEWFDRYLRERRSVSTGPAFEWIDESGEWHVSERYPPRAAGALTGAGAGTLALTPGTSPPPGSGLALFGTPQEIAVKAPIESEAGLDVVGAPRLELTYSGTAAPAATHVFAQLVDRERNVVVGNQVTPIAVTLDGARRTVSVALERVASVSTAAGYELQLVSDSTVYDIQRSAGAIDVETARIELPVTTPHVRAARTCLRYPFGSRARDELTGSNGRDCLRGRARSDRIRGLHGDDELRGERGGDRVAGGAGDDALRGGRGRDSLVAGAGEDLVRAARGGRDLIRCGPGRDAAVVSPAKDRWRGCERVRRR